MSKENKGEVVAVDDIPCTAGDSEKVVGLGARPSGDIEAIRGAKSAKFAAENMRRLRDGDLSGGPDEERTFGTIKRGTLGAMGSVGSTTPGGRDCGCAKCRAKYGNTGNVGAPDPAAPDSGDMPAAAAVAAVVAAVPPTAPVAAANTALPLTPPADGFVPPLPTNGSPTAPPSDAVTVPPLPSNDTPVSVNTPEAYHCRTNHGTPIVYSISKAVDPNLVCNAWSQPLPLTWWLRDKAKAAVGFTGGPTMWLYGGVLYLFTFDDAGNYSTRYCTSCSDKTKIAGVSRVELKFLAGALDAPPPGTFGEVPAGPVGNTPGTGTVGAITRQQHSSTQQQMLVALASMPKPQHGLGSNCQWVAAQQPAAQLYALGSKAINGIGFDFSSDGRQVWVYARANASSTSVYWFTCVPLASAPGVPLDPPGVTNAPATMQNIITHPSAGGGTQVARLMQPRLMPKFASMVGATNGLAGAPSERTFGTFRGTIGEKPAEVGVGQNPSPPYPQHIQGCTWHYVSTIAPQGVSFPSIPGGGNFYAYASDRNGAVWAATIRYPQNDPRLVDYYKCEPLTSAPMKAQGGVTYAPATMQNIITHPAAGGVPQIQKQMQPRLMPKFASMVGAVNGLAGAPNENTLGSFRGTRGTIPVDPPSAPQMQPIITAPSAGSIPFVMKQMRIMPKFASMVGAVNGLADAPSGNTLGTMRKPIGVGLPAGGGGHPHHGGWGGHGGVAGAPGVGQPRYVGPIHRAFKNNIPPAPPVYCAPGYALNSQGSCSPAILCPDGTKVGSYDLCKGDRPICAPGYTHNQRGDCVRVTSSAPIRGLLRGVGQPAPAFNPRRQITPASRCSGTWASTVSVPSSVSSRAVTLASQPGMFASGPVAEWHEGQRWLFRLERHAQGPYNTVKAYVCVEKRGVAGVGAPKPAQKAPSKSTKSTHHVERGETPHSIAKKYTGNPHRANELIHANSHKSQAVVDGALTFSRLQEGEHLVLPLNWRS